MYLVELRPGKEELYRSVDELAAAIRCGDVDMHSRIFHRATSKWISITLHPQFKAIAPVNANEPPLPQKDWTFLTSAADALDQTPPQTVDLEAGDGPESPTSSSAEPTERSSGVWRRPFTFGIAGLFVLLGAQVAFSAPRPEWPRLGFAGVSRTGVQPSSVDREDESSSVVSLASTAGLGQIGYPEPETDAERVPRSVVVPPAPAVRLSAFDEPRSADVAEKALSVETLMRRYDAAYDEARERLASGIRVAQLAPLFASIRLASAGSVAELRMNVAGATNFVHAYRAREAEIERSHQDTFALLSRRLDWPAKDIRRWYARTSHKEPRAVATLAEPLLASVDSILAVLASNAGGYRVADGSITFYQPEAAAEYRRLRQEIERYQASAVAEGGAGGVMAIVMEAIGATRLPVEISST